MTVLVSPGFGYSPVGRHPGDATPRTAMHPLIRAHLDFCRLRNLSPATITHRRENLLRIFRQLGVEDPREVTADMLTDLQETWRLSPQSHCTYASHLTAFYAFLVQRGEMAENPALAMVRPKLPRRVPRPIPDADLRIILATAPRPIRTWLTLGAHLGLRCCEIAALRREDLALDQDPPLVIVQGKGARERVLVANETARAELSGLQCQHGWLFTTPDGAPYRPNRISVRVSEWLHERGWPYSQHMARHTFLTRLYRATLDIRLCQFAAGHSSPTVTAIYTQFSPGKLVDAVRALDVSP